MAERIRIGQIGICHEHAEGKMNTLRRMPDIFEIVGVVDDRSTTAPKFAGGNLEPYSGLKWMTEEELIAAPGLRAVTVETPNTDLVTAALRCMEKGLAMHMDKPAGEDADLAAFRKLLSGCKEKRLPFQMGYMFRNNAAMQFCVKAHKLGWLGEIFEIQAGMSHDYGGEKYQDYIAKFKGGIMFNLGCHFIDFIVRLMGRPRKITPFLKSAPGYPGSVRNNCLAVLEYPHATAAVRACSREVRGGSHRRLTVCGTKGSIELSPIERFDGRPLEMRLTLLEGNEEYEAGEHTLNMGIKQDRYEDQLMELAKIIRGEMENPCAYEHDLLVQEAVLAASAYTEWK